jgi:hypothetical protein
LLGAAVAALAGALIGLLIVWASGTADTADAPRAAVTASAASPTSDADCAGREALASATEGPSTPRASVVLTRGGVIISVPSTFSLAPNITEKRTDPLWFFSSAIDAIDPVAGVRISLGVYPSAAAYLGVGTAAAAATPAPATTTPPASVAVASATGTAATIGDSFLFDAFRANAPSANGQRCDHESAPFAGTQRNVTVAYSDVNGDHVELHQRAMLLLSDGRVVILVVDGVPAIVPWADEQALFHDVLRSLSLGN